MDLVLVLDVQGQVSDIVVYGQGFLHLRNALPSQGGLVHNCGAFEQKAVARHNVLVLASACTMHRSVHGRTGMGTRAVGAGGTFREREKIPWQEVVGGEAKPNSIPPHLVAVKNTSTAI
jgi:hypothetical protein